MRFTVLSAAGACIVITLFDLSNPDVDPCTFGCNYDARSMPIVVRSSLMVSSFRSAVVGAILLLASGAPAFAEQADAARMFASRCSFCHAAPGANGGEARIPRVTLDDETRFAAVVRGGRSGARGAMPAFGADVLSDDEIRALRVYLLQEAPAERR